MSCYSSKQKVDEFKVHCGYAAVIGGCVADADDDTISVPNYKTLLRIFLSFL